MSYGTFFNQVGNVCLYNGAVISGLQYPLISSGSALLSTVAGANWQTLANKIGITGENDPAGVLATSIALTSVATGMLVKASFAAIPGLQLASFSLGVSCKLIGWYLNNREAAGDINPPKAVSQVPEEKRQVDAVAPEAKKRVAPVLVENPASPLKQVVTPSKIRSRNALFTMQKSIAGECAFKRRRKRACQLTRRTP